MPITDLSAHQGIYSSVMTVGRSRWSRICTTTSVGCGCVLTSLAFPVCLRIPIVNCWDLMESITGHTDCTFWACIHWRRLVYGGGQSIVAKKRMHEAGGPGNWVCLQGRGGLVPDVWMSWGDSTPFHVTWRQGRTQLVLFLLSLNCHWNPFLTWTQISFFFLCNQFLFILAEMPIFRWKLGKLLVQGFLGFLNMKCKEIA